MKDATGLGVFVGILVIGACVWRSPLNFWSGAIATVGSDTMEEEAESAVDGLQDRGLRGPLWLAAAALLTKEERRELSRLTPGIGGWNNHSTWNDRELRWGEDFYQSTARGKVGPRAILPLSVAREAALDRLHGTAKRVPIAELRTREGYRYCPDAAGEGVFDIYTETKSLPGVAIRTWIGSFVRHGDSFGTRARR